MVESFGKIFEDQIHGETVFKDQSKLSPDHVPEDLIHRDEEFSELSRYFKPVLETGKGKNIGEIGVPRTLSCRPPPSLQAFPTPWN